MFTTTLAAVTPFEVILFGKNNKTFGAGVVIAFFQLGHAVVYLAAKLRRSWETKTGSEPQYQSTIKFTFIQNLLYLAMVFSLHL